jgi:quercetin dioxygenase-like cupin family protein
MTTTAHSRSAETHPAPLWFLHNIAWIHVAGTASQGRVGLIEAVGAPGNMPPLHVHHDEDETFYVLEGSLELHIAGREPVVVGAGGAAFAPREIPHAYRVTSDEPARWLAVCNGARFAAFVREVSVPAESTVLPTAAEIDARAVAECAARHGIDILAPPGTLPSAGPQLT